MAKSGRRDKAEGALDKVAGRVLEAFSKLTGRRSTAAKGKAARGRGAEGPIQEEREVAERLAWPSAAPRGTRSGSASDTRNVGDRLG
jgi:uncharacterized protein YjbJ (UPF0337 family)